VAGEAIFLRVISATVDGTQRRVFIAADEDSAGFLAERKLRLGEQVTALLSENNDPQQWRYAHALGRLLSNNIEAFAGLNSHDTIKALQLRSGAECQETMLGGVTVPCPECGTEFRLPPILCRQPRSLSIEKMPRLRFERFLRRVKQYVIKFHWPSSSDGEIDAMVSNLMNGAGGA
jgi:hypothetical protein